MPLRKPIGHRSPPCDPSGGASSLTKRELQVAAYLGDESTPKAMATALGISPETVRIHIKNIQRKLGVHTRHAAVLALHKAGIPVTQQGN